MEDQSFEGNSMFTLFSINVTLTEDGFKHIEDVLAAIFSFLLLLKVTPVAEHEKAYMELKQIKDTSFKYREEKTATDNVEELAVNMMYYAAADILTGPDVFFEFDGAMVQDLIHRLNEGKFNLLFLTDKHGKYEKTEKWFGTEYDEVGEFTSVRYPSEDFKNFPSRRSRDLHQHVERAETQSRVLDAVAQRVHLHQLRHHRARLVGIVDSAGSGESF